MDISGVRTRQEISRESALVDVTAQLRNTTTRRQRGRLACTVGDDRVTKSFAVAAGRPARVRAEFEIERPRLWSPRRPFLYPLACRATVAGREESAVTQQLGLRTVAVRDGRLLLNGRPLSLRGVSVHEDHPGPGGAPGPRERGSTCASSGRSTRTPFARSTRFTLPRWRRATVRGLLVWAQVPAHALSSRQLARRCTVRQVLRLLRGAHHARPRASLGARCGRWATSSSCASRPTSISTAMSAARMRWPSGSTPAVRARSTWRRSRWRRRPRRHIWFRRCSA